MCYYVTSRLPNGTKLDELKAIFEDINMNFSTIENKNVKAQFRSGKLYLKKDYCDCVLGSSNPLPQFYMNLYRKIIINFIGF